MNFNPDTFRGHSLGMYSTWFFHYPSRCLFDCGEGCSLELGSSVFSIENIFLSHGHQDHISGIAPLLLLRSSSRGDNKKPLNIYYPHKEGRVERLFEYIINLGPLRFQCNVKTIHANEKIIIGDNSITSFETIHHDYNSLGYCFSIEKKKLKKQYLGLSSVEIIELKKSGIDINDVVTSHEFVYTGDTIPVPYPDAKVLFHECTFYNLEDVKHLSHTCLDEIKISSGVEKLVLFHSSSRYSLEYMTNRIKEFNWRDGLEVYLFYRSQLIKLV